MTIKGTKENLINLIDYLPLDAVRKIKIHESENKGIQVRTIKLDAKWFEELFENKKRCSE
jgi:hypothetical protein